MTGKNDREIEALSPDGEGRDVLNAVVRDPHTVFVTWELTGGRSAAAMSQFGAECRWVLRVLNISDNTTRSLAIDRQAGRSYVEVSPGETYGFDLVAQAGDKLRSVCRTGRLEVPDAGPSVPGNAAPWPGRMAPPALAKLRGPAMQAEPPGLRFESTAAFLGSSLPPREARTRQGPR
jgi:hypothetical protein